MIDRQPEIEKKIKDYIETKRKQIGLDSLLFETNFHEKAENKVYTYIIFSYNYENL